MFVRVIICLLIVLCSWGSLFAADVEALVRQMTLDEKITLLRGARDPENLGQAGYWPGLPRLGIPPLRLADGPPGVNAAREATAMPVPILLASTFDAAVARRFGEVLGREAAALRQDVLLAPYINIVRDPMFRRNHTTLGEDPLLSARLGAAFIEGVQAQGVMAQVKHVAAYNGPDSVFVDERTLREIYLPPFEAAVRAGVASAMCAYNRINGVSACESSEILNRVLRQEWGFPGFVTSDWGAVLSPQALPGGTDLEMPGREIMGRGGPYFGEPLAEAVRQGQIPVSAIDSALVRILKQMDRFGLLQRNRAKPPAAIDVAAHAEVTRRIAEEGAVLLKNDGSALPLAPGDLESLVVIGPTARQLVTGYLTERGSGFHSRLISPLDALRRLAPGAVFGYFVGNDLTGVPLTAPALSSATHPVREMDFTRTDAFPPGTEFNWSGSLRVEQEGDYIFMVQTALGGGAIGNGEVLVDGRTIARSSGFRGFGAVERPWSSLLPATDGLDNVRVALHLEAGSHKIELRAVSTGRSPFRVRFNWSSPAQRAKEREAAIAAATKARTAVIFAWHEPGESLSLPEEQDELIRRVAAVNSRTIVVLNAGAPVVMPWKDDVKAVLLMWYPGQEGGRATANLLLGRANPSGKLPVTFPAKLEDTPARAPGHPERWAPSAVPGSTGVDRNPPPASFSEGLAVGYRWYDQARINPLFAFGHGLSYTRFEYSDLRIKPQDGGFAVTFAVRNSGARDGAEVAQLYLGPPEYPAETRPPQWLAGFARVELKAGQRRDVTIHLDSRALSVWSTGRHAWVPEGGREVLVGSSSRDVRLRGQISATTPDSP